MPHEEILSMLGDYVDYLIANSSAEAPMWNIEVYKRQLPVLPAARYRVHRGRAGRGRDPEPDLCHRD